MRIGVLAVQGDFLEHELLLSRLHAQAIEVRQIEDLKNCSGLIIPGGESPTISGFLKRRGLDKKIVHLARHGFPVLGTCAGAIILSEKISNEKNFRPLGLIGITVKRNSYGRQVDSFEAPVKLLKPQKEITGIFIRSPEIVSVKKGVDVLGTLEGKPVFVREKNIFALAFHPELSENTEIHKTFLKEAREFEKHKKPVESYTRLLNQKALKE